MNTKVVIATALCADLTAGLILAYFSVVFVSSSMNLVVIASAFIFWVGLVSILLAFPLRAVFLDFTRSLKTVLGLTVFVSYLATSLLLVFLEGIHGSQLLGVSTSSLYVYTDTFVPRSLVSALLKLSYNPEIIFTFPPGFSAALSFYIISMYVVIAVLVVANVMKTRAPGKLYTAASKRARSFLVLITGIAISSVALSGALASNLIVYYFTYFVLPAFAVAILYLNYVSLSRERGVQA